MPDETQGRKGQGKEKLSEVSKHPGFSRPSSEMSCLKDARVHEGRADCRGKGNKK